MINASDLELSILDLFSMYCIDDIIFTTDSNFVKILHNLVGKSKYIIFTEVLDDNGEPKQMFMKLTKKGKELYCFRNL